MTDKTQDPKAIIRDRFRVECEYTEICRKPGQCFCDEKAGDAVTALEAAGLRVVSPKDAEELIGAFAFGGDMVAAFGILPTYSQGGDDVQST